MPYATGLARLVAVILAVLVLLGVGGKPLDLLAVAVILAAVA